LTVTPFAVFAAAALLAQPEANWPAPAHPLLLAGALAWLSNLLADRNLEPRRARRLRTLLWLALASSLLLTSLGAIHLLRPLPGFPPEGEPAARLRAWQDLPDWLPTGGNLCADDYELAAALSYHRGDRMAVSSSCGPPAALPDDAVVLVAAPGSGEAPAPDWFRGRGHCATEIGRHPMRRGDGAVVRTLVGYRLVPCGQVQAEGRLDRP
jgi:hypothetical protein